MYTTQTQLLTAVRDAQNREAWGDFYRIYAPMLRQFARRMGLPDNETDDLTQDVLMIAHHCLCDHKYDPARGSFRTYLYGIARRQTLACLRARGRRTRVQHVADEGATHLIDQIEDTASDEAAAVLWQQEWRFALLDEGLRQVRPIVGEKPFVAFQRFAIENRPVQEVAEALAIAPASVYVYKSRVLAALREWLERFEDTDPPEEPSAAWRHQPD